MNWGKKGIYICKCICELIICLFVKFIFILSEIKIIEKKLKFFFYCVYMLKLYILSEIKNNLKRYSYFKEF